MGRPRIDFELPEDMDKQELENMYETFEKYTVELPNEEEINMTIDTLRQYVPHKKRRVETSLNRPLLLMNRAITEVTFISKAYWISSIVLFILGYMFTVSQDRNPYIMAMILAPIPFILGIIEVFRGREEGMLEIELSCRISAGEIMFSRMTLIGIYNILLNSFFSLAMTSSIGSINMFRMTLLWLTPFTLISGFALLIAMKIRSGYTTTIFISSWMVLVFWLSTSNEAFETLMNINIGAYITVIIVGLLIIASQAIRILRRYSGLERSILIEINS